MLFRSNVLQASSGLPYAARVSASADVSPRTPTRPARGWDRTRRALAVGWLLLAVTIVVVGERPVSLGQLEGELASGRVDTVRVAGGLPAGAQGFSTQEVRYREGGLARWLELWQVSPGVDAPGDSLGDGDRLETVVTSDLGADLARRHPGVVVVREEPPGSFGTVGSWRVPVWVSGSAIVWSLAVLCLLLAGPQPSRATRWAWFWLLSTPVGALAFLVLAGPTPPLPTPREGARRLTGGWALLLALAVAAWWASLG